jgi:hypothetical protein
MARFHILSVSVLLAVAACGEQSRAPTDPESTSRQPDFITNGTPTGTDYGNVGALLIDENGDRILDFICTGSLVSPTVFLTAGHCTAFGASAAYYVSFAPVVLPLPPLIQATEAHTAYPDLDLGVVLLPAGSTAGISPLELPPEGYLAETLSRGGFGHQRALIVGYGEASLGQGRRTSGSVGVREVASTKVLWLQGELLGLAGNAVAAGRGGSCFGDSGGPVFLEGQDPDLVVGVTSFGLEFGCHSIGAYFRVDTPAARSFLGQFMTLP